MLRLYVADTSLGWTGFGPNRQCWLGWCQARLAVLLMIRSLATSILAGNGYKSRSYKRDHHRIAVGPTTDTQRSKIYKKVYLPVLDFKMCLYFPTREKKEAQNFFKYAFKSYVFVEIFRFLVTYFNRPDIVTSSNTRNITCHKDTSIASLKYLVKL